MEVLNFREIKSKENLMTLEVDAPSFDFKKYMFAIHYKLERKFGGANNLKRGSKYIQKKGFVRDFTICKKHNRNLREFTACFKIKNKRREKSQTIQIFESKLKNVVTDHSK